MTNPIPGAQPVVDPDFLPADAAAPLAPSQAPEMRRVSLATQYTPAANVSFGRLLLVEGRKLINTTTGKVLGWVALGLTIAWTIGSGFYFGWLGKMMADLEAEAGPGPQMPFNLLDWMSISTSVSGFAMMFVAILGIFLVTGEWSQRTALTTFALEPRRWRVLAAKALVVVIVATVIALLSFVLGAGSTLIAEQVSGMDVTWGWEWKRFVGFLLTTVLGALMGMAFGLLTLNGAAAIVMYFAVPMVLGVLPALGLLWEWVTDVAPWVDPSTSQVAVMSGNWSGAAWAQLAVTHLVWIGIPLAVGTWRWLTKEAKSD